MKQKKTLLYLCLAACVLLIGCAAGYEKDQYAPEPSFGSEGEAPLMREVMKSDASGLMEDDGMAVNESVVRDEAPSSAPEKPSAEAERKRIYNGSAGLVVDEKEAVRKELETLAMETGGYIESSYADYLVLRIPAAQFHKTFDRILLMGTVDFQEISSFDVTDQFSDLERRLDTALKTRERLYDLLERTKDAEERAAILREIGRLSEEIEALKQQKELLESRIAFSRITVTLIPRLQEGDMGRSIPFDWIAYLDPLYPVSGRLHARVTLDPGDDFAIFDRESVFMAEDAEGNSLFISSVDNHPEGDSLFWQRALHFHMKDYYESAETLTIPMGNKEFLAVRFISRDREPFSYTVGILADGSKLHILEIFTPSADTELTDLKKAISKGEIR